MNNSQLLEILINSLTLWLIAAITLGMARMVKLMLLSPKFDEHKHTGKVAVVNRPKTGAELTIELYELARKQARHHYN